MGRQERMALIAKLEQMTDSKVLVYVTGDRRGLETRISSDVLPFVFNHLSKFGQVPKISIFLYTTGGLTISGFALVNMIREFCDKFGALIPFKALSTGTLMAMGADTIAMTRLGQLGPVDPSVNHPLGPVVPHPQNPVLKVSIPVNVEDVLSFFDLAKKSACVQSEDQSVEVFKLMSGGIHPLTLGAVNRARNQIKFLAKTLLNYHISNSETIERIVKTLLEERFSHDYIIGRKEAKNVVGLNVLDMPKELDETMMQLYQEYAILMKLDRPYNPEVELEGNTRAPVTFYRGIVESVDMSTLYVTKKDIQKVQIQQQGMPAPVNQYLESILQEGWVDDNSI